eukprot:gene9500-11254_t
MQLKGIIHNDITGDTHPFQAIIRDALEDPVVQQKLAAVMKEAVSSRVKRPEAAGGLANVIPLAAPVGADQILPRTVSPPTPRARSLPWPEEQGSPSNEELQGGETKQSHGSYVPGGGMGDMVVRKVAPDENKNCPHANTSNVAAPDIDRVSFVPGISDSTLLPSQKVLTSYFTSKKDPQRFSRTTGLPRWTQTNNFAYIQKWCAPAVRGQGNIGVRALFPEPGLSYGLRESDLLSNALSRYESVVRLELRAVIFHDGLGDDFTSNYTTPLITFIQVRLSTGLSGVDERWFVYHHYLRQHNYRYALMTDISDVILDKNPFDFMESTAHQNDLWVGSEKMAGQLSGSRWMVNKYNKCYGGLIDQGVVYNCGIVGGKREHLIRLFEHVECEMRTMAKFRAMKEEMCDM